MLGQYPLEPGRVHGAREEFIGFEEFRGEAWRRSVAKGFKVGDHVSWNSEAGRVSGTIVRAHTRDFDVKGYTHHATADAPQYEIKSAKTNHIAFHMGSALTKFRD